MIVYHLYHLYHLYQLCKMAPYCKYRRMISEEQKSAFPITYCFKTGSFKVKMELNYNKSNEEVFTIELEHLLNQNIFICSIDPNKLRSNPSLQFFDRPSNLFLEMTGVLDRINISEHGQIQFELLLGQKNTYPITLLATLKGEAEIDEYLKMQEEFRKSLQINTALKLKYAENAAQIMKKIGILNKLTRDNSKKQEQLQAVMYEYTLLANKRRQYNYVKEGLLRAQKKRQEMKDL